LNAVTFNIPLYFQAVLLESATSSGLRLIVPVICAAAAGTATGFLITWTRRLKWLLVWGSIFLCLGTTGLSLMPRGLPHWAYILFIIPSNVGQGMQSLGSNSGHQWVTDCKTNRFPVPSHIHERPRRLRASRTGSCDKHPDPLEKHGQCFRGSDK
jgi:hypothetical protein